MAFELKSTAISPGREIPKKHTYDGQDISPELSWSDPPEDTKSFALIMDDPTASVGTWVHWLLFDLPASTRGLPEGMPKSQKLNNGACQGRNDFYGIGYGGPCPPIGPSHNYFFKLYALDARTKLHPGAIKSELESAMQGHILAQAVLMGIYKR